MTQGKPAWNRKEHPTIVCEGCGKPFEVRPYRLSNARYCSRDCKKVGDKERLSVVNGHRTDLWTPEEIEFLVASFPATLTENLCAFLPRHPLQSIQAKASDLKLKKTKEYRLAYLEENRRNAIAALQGSSPWNKSEPIEKICPNCNATFTVFGSLKFQLCCNSKCAYELKSKVRGVNHPLYKAPAERICQWCGKAFQCKPAKVTYGEGLYCSRNCLGSASCKLQQGRRSSLEVAVEQVLIALEEPFETQKQIGPWLVDFYLPDRNLVLECDGKYWHGREEVAKRDKQKDGYLYKHGYQVLRLGEDIIRADAMEAVKQGLNHTRASIVNA